MKSKNSFFILSILFLIFGSFLPVKARGIVPVIDNGQDAGRYNCSSGAFLFKGRIPPGAIENTWYSRNEVIQIFINMGMSKDQAIQNYEGSAQFAKQRC